MGEYLPLTEEHLTYVGSALMGIGLAAACGFRVFLPLLVVGVFGRMGWVEILPSFSWLASWPGITCLAVATVLETGAMFVPWLDSALTAMATPFAILAGAFLATTVTEGQSTLYQYVIPIIAGGATAGVIHGVTTAVKGVSSAVTGGSANPLVALGELFAAIVTTILAVVVPVLLVLLATAFVVAAGWFVMRWRRRRTMDGMPATKPAVS